MTVHVELQQQQLATNDGTRSDGQSAGSFVRARLSARSEGMVPN